MSKQIGPIGLDGRVGNISFFYRKGVASARLKSRGLSKERILTDPDLKRVRENMSEFSGHVVMANAFKDAIAKVTGIVDGTVRNRVMRVFATVKKRSGGVRGQRAFNLSQFKSLLKNFELNAEAPLQRVYGPGLSGITSTPSAARNSATVQVTIDNPEKQILAPPEATHFQVAHLLAVIPDAVFNADDQAYALTAPELAGVSMVSTSEQLPLGTTEPVTVSLETTLPLESIPDHATVIEAVGIECFQEMDGAHYFLKEGRGMRIINTF